jgi:hypothetical protein
MAVSFSALLVATLVMLALHRIDAAIAVALAWCLPMAHPSTVPNELGRYRDRVAVIDAPCPGNNRSARRTTYWRAELHPWQAQRSDVAGGQLCTAVSACAPGQILERVATAGDFDPIWATLGALPGRNQRAVTVFCTRL